MPAAWSPSSTAPSRPTSRSRADPYADVLVIGAGFGGPGAALSLAERVARVVVYEALAYPGGCASTFVRKGHRFEAGATLSSGLAPHQLFGGWIERHALPVTVDWIVPVGEVRVPGLSLPIARSRERFVETLCAFPGAPELALRRFFTDQHAMADTLWALFDAPDLLPPLTPAALATHAARLPRLLPLLRAAGRPLTATLARYGIEGFAPLRAWLGGLFQITVQCEPHEAETPFALAAMDYF